MDCRICLVPHDAEIHRATADVHDWLRSDMAYRISKPPAVPQKKPRGTLVAPAVVGAWSRSIRFRQ